MGGGAREALRAAAVDMVEPDLRRALEEIAEAEAEAEEERLPAGRPARRTRPRAT